MKTENNILFWIAGVAMYTWSMFVFANYLLQSFWLISFQSSRVIEEGVELFLF